MEKENAIIKLKIEYLENTVNKKLEEYSYVN
jgi:hypothetical protein